MIAIMSISGSNPNKWQPFFSTGPLEAMAVNPGHHDDALAVCALPFRVVKKNPANLPTDQTFCIIYLDLPDM